MMQANRAGEIGYPATFAVRAVFGLCVDAQNAFFSKLKRLFDGFDRARLRQARGAYAISCYPQALAFVFN